MNQIRSEVLAFIQELSGFAQIAEETLQKIENDKDGSKGLFSVFSERMFEIRGTASQLNLPHVAEIAGLGEEIAVKGSTAETRSQIRKCIGSLWDALTTIKFMLGKGSDDTDEEQEILIHRLQSTLKAFGGARPTVGVDEIEALLKNRSERS